MENPKTWGKVKKAIDAAIREHHKALEAHMPGASDVTTIYNVLRSRGFVVEDTPEEE